MRVLLIHNRFGSTARGGAERVVERLADALRTRGHDVTVATPRRSGQGNRSKKSPAGDVLGYAVPNAVPFERLERLPVPLRAVWHAIDLLNVPAAWTLRRVLRRIRPDVVHTHNLVGCGGLTPWVIRHSDIPWVHTLHDVQLVTPSGLLVRDRPATALERSFLGTWFRALRRWLFGSPSVVTSPSRWLLDLHVRHGFFPNADRAIIGNPIDRIADSHLRNPRGAPTVRLLPRIHHGVSQAVRKFAFVGQVEGVKGINVLIEAFRQLRGLAPDVVLQVVGDGALLPALKRIARDVRGLILRGRLDADGVWSAIAESDVLVVPSLVAENQPSTILEAFALGVPVVASRVGGIPELVRDSETGFLVESGSCDDLVRALRLCVEEPDRIPMMSDACRAAADEHATPAIAQRYEEAYTRAAHARQRFAREHSSGHARRRG